MIVNNCWSNGDNGRLSYTMLPYVNKLGLADDRIASWERCMEAGFATSFRVGER